MSDQEPHSGALDAKAEAKLLLRVAREAALATQDRTSGGPFVTLVGVASAYDGAPLLLLSTLSSHTKNLALDARASLLLTSPRLRGDPLNRPRLTLVGALAQDRDPKAKARYLARNPKAKLYAGFTDFAIFRLETSAVHFNGGFARAAPLTPTEIATDLSDATALLSAEAALLGDVNNREPSFLAELAGRQARWRAIGLDPDGLDLASGASVGRASFATPVTTPAAWLQSLEKLAERRP
jgi:hypothetical protein